MFSITIISFLLVGVSFLAFYLYNELQKVKRKDVRVVGELLNYQSMIDMANDALLVIDIADGKILATNPSACAMLGYSQGQLEQLSFFNLHPQEYLTTSSERIADVWEKQGLIFSDIPFIKSSGEIVDVECSAKVTSFARKPALVMYARDITERVRLQAKIKQQNAVIEEKNKDIIDSINYASRIQRAIMPDEAQIADYCSEAFILFKPKDVVSGDFFWYASVENMFLFAAVDCTGHGVPGALMSMIGMYALNGITRKRSIQTSAEVLDKVNTHVLLNLARSGDSNEVRDGMEIAFCAFNRDTSVLNYAGANRPILVVKTNGEVIEYKPNKFPIGGHNISDKHFTDHTIQLEKGDSVYLFTDGFADQFGGPDNKKFKYKNLKALISNVQDKSIAQQKQIIDTVFEDWRGDNEQLDDVLVMGIKI